MRAKVGGEVLKKQMAPSYARAHTNLSKNRGKFGQNNKKSLTLYLSLFLAQIKNRGENVFKTSRLFNYSKDRACDPNRPDI